MKEIFELLKEVDAKLDRLLEALEPEDIEGDACPNCTIGYLQPTNTTLQPVAGGNHPKREWVCDDCGFVEYKDISNED